MELFHRRYFAFFAFLFLFASFGAIFLSGVLKIILALVAVALVIAAVILLIFNKKHRFAFSVALVSFAFVCVALLNSFLFITLPKEKALNYIGDSQAIKMTIISKVADHENSSEYTARITDIGKDSVSIKSYLYCESKEEFYYGDTVIALGDISKAYGSAGIDRDILLSVYVAEDAPMIFDRAEEINYFSEDGFAHICNNIRSSFGDYVDSLFGKENGALVKGFLINDKSDVPFQSIPISNARVRFICSL